MTVIAFLLGVLVGAVGTIALVTFWVGIIAMAQRSAEGPKREDVR